MRKKKIGKGRKRRDRNERKEREWRMRGERCGG